MNDLDKLMNLMVEHGELNCQSHPDGPTVYEDMGGGIWTEPSDIDKATLIRDWITSLDKKEAAQILLDAGFDTIYVYSLLSELRK